MLLAFVLALGIMAALALLLGAVLGWAAIRYKVDEDPLVDKIDAILPQTQCGQCGFPGCKPYATAIAGDEPISIAAHLAAKTASANWRICSAKNSNRSMLKTAKKSPSHWRWWMNPFASVAPCACRPVRWMPSSARPSTCIPWYPANAPAANCAWRRARWIALISCRWAKP